MNVTVCELCDGSPNFADDWERLVRHTTLESSELVVLPEMPFAPWLPQSRHFDSQAWESAVKAHDHWELRLQELGAAIVAGTRPVNFGAERYNEGFVWTASDGFRGVHVKSELRNEKDCWESIWYTSTETADFESIEVRDLSFGFLIGDELAASEQAERYGREGVHLLISPRSTPVAHLEEWLGVGRSSAQRANAFELSSSRAGQGPGWIIGPRGDMMALTSTSQPFVSLAIDCPVDAYVTN